MNDKIHIFCDGASKGNPGPGGWGAIVHTSDGEIKEIGAGEKHTTNNKMELTAAINALKSLKTNKYQIILHTDSSYVINGMTKWIKGWQKNNWITSQKEEVSNRDLWEKLIDISSKKKIEWKYVGGHIGIAGNERADSIAASFASGDKPKLFKGKYSNYQIDISNLDGHTEMMKERAKDKGKAYSYLSLVNGVLRIDKTWKECEKRVKGVKNAKYKKSISPEDEKRIIEEWSR